MSKYKNKRTEVDGILFDSKKEAKRYEQLHFLELAGFIEELRLQVPFELIPAQKDKDGKTIERACVYKADFVYLDNASGEVVVEDVKGKRTPEYIIKRKLMLYRYNIRVREL